jgi:hypothetical protein
LWTGPGRPRSRGDSGLLSGAARLGSASRETLVRLRRGPQW